jgi:hypothetical protein
LTPFWTLGQLPLILVGLDQMQVGLAECRFAVIPGLRYALVAIWSKTPLNADRL